jgi:hypothetical protein
MQLAKGNKKGIRLSRINKWWWIGGSTASLLAVLIAFGLVKSGLVVNGKFENKEETLFPIVKDGKVGYIKETGAIAISPNFEDDQGQRDFSEGLSPVLVKGKWGFINTAGQIVIKAQYDEVSDFSEGFASVVIGDQVSCINQSGKVIYNVAPEDDLGPFSEGLAPVRLGDRWGFIDTNGQFAINPQFDEVGVFANGLAMVLVGGKIGYINRSGKMAINPQYEDASKFSRGIAPIKQGEQWGFINKSGEVVIAPQFSSLQMTQESYGWVGFKDGLTAVEVGGQWGFINKSGKMVITPQFIETSGFSEGLAAVKLGERWGYINKKGRIVINPQYDEAQTFKDGLAAVTAQKSGYINTAGQFVWSADNVGYLSPQRLAAQEEAASYIGSINRAQQAFYIENNRFTSQLQELGLGLDQETENYSYGLTLIGRDRVKVTSIPKVAGMKSYLGYVARIPFVGERESFRNIEIVCQSNNPSQTALYPPQIVGEAFQCAPGSSQL